MPLINDLLHPRDLWLCHIYSLTLYTSSLTIALYQKKKKLTLHSFPIYVLLQTHLLLSVRQKYLSSFPRVIISSHHQTHHLSIPSNHIPHITQLYLCLIFSAKTHTHTHIFFKIEEVCNWDLHLFLATSHFCFISSFPRVVYTYRLFSYLPLILESTLNSGEILDFYLK